MKLLEDPLPTPYELPKNYPPIVEAGVQPKSLNGIATVKFITEIAHAIFHFKTYPTRDPQAKRQRLYWQPFCNLLYFWYQFSCRSCFVISVSVSKESKVPKKPRLTRFIAKLKLQCFPITALRTPFSFCLLYCIYTFSLFTLQQPFWIWNVAWIRNGSWAASQCVFHTIERVTVTPCSMVRQSHWNLVCSL